MTTKHTSGPWRADIGSDFTIIRGPDGDSIAAMRRRTGDRFEEEQDANARLIAAALHLGRPVSGAATPTTTAVLALRLARLEARVARLEGPAGAPPAPAAEPAPPPPPRLRAIIAATAAECGVTEAQLLSSQRKFALARQVAMYLARSLTPASLPAIGRAFRRDHSTVLHAVRLIEARAAADADFAERLDAIAATARRLTERAAAAAGRGRPGTTDDDHHHQHRGMTA